MAGKKGLSEEQWNVVKGKWAADPTKFNKTKNAEEWGISRRSITRHVAEWEKEAAEKLAKQQEAIFSDEAGPAEYVETDPIEEKLDSKALDKQISEAMKDAKDRVLVEYKRVISLGENVIQLYQEPAQQEGIDILDYLETSVAFYEEYRVKVQEMQGMINERNALLVMAKDEVFDRDRENDLFDRMVEKIVKARLAACPFPPEEIQAIFSAILFGGNRG